MPIPPAATSAARPNTVRRLPRVLATVVVGLSLAATGYAVVAYRAYHRVRPADRPCLDCGTPVTVNGYQLLVREVGSDTTRPPVIAVHGGPGHSSLSFRQSLDFLGTQRRLVYYDQRGSGNSQSKDRLQDFVIDSLVEELEALRRDVVKADKVVLLGHSFGSALVQRYALRYASHVDKLVIVGGIRLNNGMTNRFVWRWLGPALLSTALGFPQGTGDDADRWFTTSDTAGSLARLFDPKKGALLDSTGTVRFAAWHAISFSLVGDAQEDALGRLDIPTLVLYGAADTDYTGEPTAKAMCAVLPRCTPVAFLQSGHWPFLEEPVRFQQVVGDFLTEDPSRPGR
ncbi:MAG: alpha/beta hydrolase [Gemmatimonadetes bacterium]|nr:alpha/beta hydrolase [Gemmatimonadota bacterium]